MIDPIFGDISFTDAYGWEGSYTYPFLGDDATVRLGFWADEASDPVEIQREALRLFTEHKDELCAQAENAIYAYYLEQQPELREQFGDSADRLMPILSGKQELGRVVKPQTLFIVEPLRSDDRVIGLLDNCTWDDSHGLAVKIVNEKIVEVGPQDIVL
ncbi:DUF6985 domain-containing protein [Mycobacteroides abscessus]|uniref:DUF6985 domain-containing protein n=1 Tax=Mycobacteroides abscessus TaxID=36809 RepID=UPI000C265D22|nr:hypothetical protein [Mycobacteroides abscessus]RIS58119.1 hypothetical protein D2E46_01480 [Mycobacteroides abscessus]